MPRSREQAVRLLDGALGVVVVDYVSRMTLGAPTLRVDLDLDLRPTLAPTS
ncbi:hypothetical protein [Streptomyces pseudovenezuelae]|uniref:hypothetical protein n=1 Tax=Streptomyces pseudovenezuelae TaxID=67350 RepID=UPI0036E2493B